MLRRLAIVLCLIAGAAWILSDARADGAAPLPPRSVCSNPSIPAGNTITNSVTTEQTFGSTCNLGALPANTLYLCEAKGVFTVPALNIPNLQGKIKLNGVTVLDTGAIPALVSGTALAWQADFTIATMSDPTQVDVQGKMVAKTGATSDLPIDIGNAVLITIDPTNVVLTLSATWSTNTGTSSIRLSTLGCK